MSLYTKSSNATQHISFAKDKSQKRENDYTYYNGHIRADPDASNKITRMKHHYGSVKELTQVHRRSAETKHVAVKAFVLKLQTEPGHRYQPGNEIVGSIMMDIAQTMEICYVEFSVVGYGIVKSRNPSKCRTVMRKERYLSKTTKMFGNAASDYDCSVIEPGVYNTKFKFLLPTNLASSVSYIDLRGTFVFEISYSVRAAIVTAQIESIRRSGIHDVKKYPLLRRKVVFFVMRDFDINVVPNAMWPNKITDNVSVGCSLFDASRFEATAIIERGIYVCGDTLRVSVETEPKLKAKVHAIHTELKQTIYIRESTDPVYGVINAVKEKRVEWCTENDDTEEEMSVYHLSIPTPPDMLPSDIPGTKLISVSYKIHVTIYLTRHNAKLLLELPVLFGPCGMIQYPWQRGRGGLPVFNCPTRFPNFARSRNTSDNSLKSIATYKSLAELNDSMALRQYDSHNETLDTNRALHKKNLADIGTL